MKTILTALLISAAGAGIARADSVKWACGADEFLVDSVGMSSIRAKDGRPLPLMEIVYVNAGKTFIGTPNSETDKVFSVIDPIVTNKKVTIAKTGDNFEIQWDDSKTYNNCKKMDNSGTEKSGKH